MPGKADLVEAAGPAEEEGVTYDLGTKFATGDDPGRNKARLCFSFNTEKEIREGIARLARVLDRAGMLTTTASS